MQLCFYNELAGDSILIKPLIIFTVILNTDAQLSPRANRWDRRLIGPLWWCQQNNKMISCIIISSSWMPPDVAVTSEGPSLSDPPLKDDEWSQTT